MEEKNKALEKLLLDIDILNELDKWTNDVNFFEVSGMTNQEIRHSNTLAWFLDPNENHGFKDQVIKRFLQKVISANVGTVKGIDIFDISLIDYATFTIKREWKNIDLLIYSEELKIVITIENKIYSTEGRDQLSRYHQIIQKEFNNYNKYLYVYLTREGEEPSDVDNWCIASYKMIVEALEESLNANITISNKVKTLTTDYISIVRRNFGMDDELRKIAKKIYLKHKQAFDLIYEVASTSHIHFSDFIKNWLKENKENYSLNYDEKYSSGSIIRFTTPYIDKLFPFDETKSDGWGFGYSFMYEIKISKERIALFGVLANFERPGSKLLMEFDKTARAMKYRNVLRAQVLLTESDIADGLSDEVIIKLNEQLKQGIIKHIQEFESKVIKFSEGK